MTFNELLARYESATAGERQRVLELLPQGRLPIGGLRSAWEKALREVFGPRETAR